MEAIKEENVEIVDILLKIPNTNVNEKNSSLYLTFNGQRYSVISPLLLAMNVENVKIFDLLLNHPKIDINMAVMPVDNRSTIWTPLHMSIMLENYSFAEKLIKQPNIDVNFKANFDESTSIFDFFEVHHFDVFYTPLQLAVELENIEIIKLLLSHPKILLNEIEKYLTYTKLDYYGSCNHKIVEQSVLHRSIQKNNLEIIKLLLDQPELDVNIFAVFTFNPGNSFYGFSSKEVESTNTVVKKTALHLAYQTNDQNIIQLLLSRKDIDVDALDEERKKPNEVSKSVIFDQKGYPFNLISFDYALCLFVISSSNIKKNPDSHLICVVRTDFDSGVTFWDVRENWNQFFKLGVHSLSEKLRITVKKLESYHEDDVATTELDLSSFNLGDKATEKVYDLNPVNDNDAKGKIHLKISLCNMKETESLDGILIYSLMNF